MHADGDSNGGWDRLADLPDLSGVSLKVSTAQHASASHTESAKSSPGSTDSGPTSKHRLLTDELELIKVYHFVVA